MIHIHTHPYRVDYSSCFYNIEMVFLLNMLLRSLYLSFFMVNQDENYSLSLIILSLVFDRWVMDPLDPNTKLSN